MSALTDFAYAQARIQARYGERPPESLWQQLDGVADLALYLEHARATPLRPWVANLSAAMPVHELETRLRAALQALIEELAGWLPRPWTPSLRWLGLLAGLPVAQHLARGAQALPWMGSDERLAPLLAGAGLPARLQQACAQDQAWLLEAWLEGWSALWPPMGPRERGALEGLVQLLRSHLLGFARLPVAAAWQARLALQRRLQLRFRRSAFGPAAAFAYLALVALDLERLRAALIGRLLYPQRRSLP